MIKRFKPLVKEIDYEGVYVADPVRNVFPEYDNIGRMRLSVSRMQLFEKCFLAFKFSYVDKLDIADEAGRELLDTGKDLHDIFYKASFQIHPEIVRSLECYNEWGEHLESFISLQKTFASAYGDHRPYMAEKEIFDAQDFVVLYIDRINMLPDGTVEVLDYKTGSVHSLSRHHFQLSLYAYYVEKHLGLRVSKWSIFYTKHNKYKSENVDRAKIRMIPEIVGLIRERIDECFSRGVFEKRPSQMCGWCPMLQYGLCSSSTNKSYNSFGLLEIYSKPWNSKEDIGDRYLCGGIRVTR
jgi:CRISPR/Cas system-associated exonuclease Cas4 (RecB family)